MNTTPITDQINVKSIFLALNQKPIAYYPIYRQLAKSTTGGILLSQIMYWSSAMKGEEFYKTDKDLMQETGLSTDELRLAKSNLKKLSFVSLKLKGIPAKTFWNIDYDLLFQSINALKEHDQAPKQDSGKSLNSDRGNPDTVLGETPKLGSGKSLNIYITENKSEIKTEIKTEREPELENLSPSNSNSKDHSLERSIEDLKDQIKSVPMYPYSMEAAIKKGYTEKDLWEELLPRLIIYLNDHDRTNIFTKFNYWIKDLRSRTQNLYQKAKYQNIVHSYVQSSNKYLGNTWDPCPF